MLRATRIALAALAIGPLHLAAQTGHTDSVGVLTIGGAARLAAAQSAPAEAARLRAEQADARVTQARSALLPQVTVGAGNNQRTFNTATFGINLGAFDPDGEVLGPVNTYDVRGRVSANLFDPAAMARVRAARTAASAADLESIAQAEGAASQAAAAYVRVLHADGVLQARQADSTLASELVTIAREQLRAGTGVALDVTRAEAQLAGTRAQLIGARNERDRAQLDLRRVLNLSLDAPIVLADTLTALAARTPDVGDERVMVQEALARRPDLRAAQRQVDAAKRNVKATRAENLPAVSAFADEGVLGKSVDHLLNTYTWGVQVSMPLFDGFRREARVDEQQAVASEAEVRRRDLERQAAVEVRGALLDLRAAQEQSEAARERLRLSEQEVSQARQRFRAGVAGNADVVTASLSLTTARTALIDALTLQQSAQVALARARGAVTQLP